jgi:hypothetical protein
MKWILSILNERSGFEISASNDAYKINIGMFFKI